MTDGKVVEMPGAAVAPEENVSVELERANDVLGAVEGRLQDLKLKDLTPVERETVMRRIQRAAREVSNRIDALVDASEK